MRKLCVALVCAMAVGAMPVDAFARSYKSGKSYKSTYSQGFARQSTRGGRDSVHRYYERAIVQLAGRNASYAARLNAYHRLSGI